MVSVNDFKRGLVIKLDGELYSVIEYQHVKPARGAAFVRSKLRHIKRGAVVDRTFRGGEKVEDGFCDEDGGVTGHPRVQTAIDARATGTKEDDDRQEAGQIIIPGLSRIRGWENICQLVASLMDPIAKVEA